MEKLKEIFGVLSLKFSQIAASPTGKLVLLIVAIVYTVSPIDLIPDAVPIAGWLDDIGVDIVVLKGVLSGFLLKKANDFVQKSLDEASATGDAKTMKVAEVTYAVANAQKAKQGTYKQNKVASEESAPEVNVINESKIDDKNKEMNFF